MVNKLNRSDPKNYYKKQATQKPESTTLFEAVKQEHFVMWQVRLSTGSMPISPEKAITTVKH